MIEQHLNDFKDMLPEEIHHGAYIREGHMAAMPLCFPGVTTPVDANESFITSLAVAPDEIIYGGTSGKLMHIFAAFTRGSSGIVVDLGGDGESTECIGLAYTKKQIIAGVNGKKGGRIICRQLQNMPFDCIQEWIIDLPRFKVAIQLSKNEQIIDLISNTSQNGVIGTTENGVFTWSEVTNELVFYHNIKITYLTKDGNSNIYGIDKAGQVYLVNDNKGKIKTQLGDKTKGNFKENAVWSNKNPKETVYLSDGNGQLFRVNISGKVEKIGQTHLHPVTCMTVTNDGRLFGFCGREMANLFVYKPQKDTIRDLGVAISVLNRRRYGYEFACAVTNKDGEIYFGENDRGGHLWVYFPAII